MEIKSDVWKRFAAVSLVCTMMVLTLGGLGYMVSRAMGFMASSADAMDDARALSAAKGALTALKKQLSATVRDNAYWDDAYTNTNGPASKTWAIENWGATTVDYPLYDTALVANAGNAALIAWHKGKELPDADAFFLGQLTHILQAARSVDYAADVLPVAFIKTKDGIALIGAAAIQPSETPDFKMENARVLVFSKQLSGPVVEELAETFSISGLTLTEGPGNASLLHADVTDIKGTEIASITWPPLHPGSASYERIRPTVLIAAATLLMVLFSMAMFALFVIRTIRHSERSANYKAKHDSLTGLWNRAGCFDALDRMLARHHSGVHLLLLDLDGFKPVNDAWGHPVGDRLIKAVSSRLVETLPGAVVIARLGGDEFAVISDGHTVDSTAMADVVLATLTEPFIIDERIIEIGGSIGCASNCRDSVELVRRADLALYSAKSLGRGTAVDYEERLDAHAQRGREEERELRQSLQDNEIQVVFQPLIEASTHTICGVEALARWTSPTRGPVSPDRFISVAERAGLIDQLGFSVLRTALREGSRWPGIGVAVNISPLQLKNPYFCRQVEEVLVECHFEPSRLTIEVTEGVLISDPDQAKRAFAGLRALGIKIALDDFGCGYASIGTLREFGFDSMKIDRSLISGLNRDSDANAVLQATVALANALHLPVTAEGIETEEQAAVVRLSGCNKLQGYLFSKPVPAEQISARFFGYPSAQAS